MSLKGLDSEGQGECAVFPHTKAAPEAENPERRTEKKKETEKTMMRPMKLAGSELMFGEGCLAYIKTMPYRKSVDP